MNDLKPCPFCGGEGRHYVSSDNHVISCTSCDATIHHSLWNNRAAENKIKADAVLSLKDWLVDYLSAVDLSDTAVMYIEEYADKLERGE